MRDLPTTDIDLAVKFSDHLTLKERFRHLCVLSGNLQLSDRPFADVSDLEALPTDIAHDAVQGRLVYGSEHQLGAFRKNVEEEFEDQREVIRAKQRSVIERIADHG